ncbi:MAG: tetratricopeptide repeat protein, partial [Planctomycetes bacterium]|nr:tetratricopeptide repeat protein [Planctomycetota bacterium]
MNHSVVRRSFGVVVACWLPVSATLMAAVTVAGCAKGITDRPGSGSGRQESGQAVEARRAGLALGQIEPIDPAVPPATATPAPLSARGRRRIDKARTLYGEQRFTEAALQLERALQSDPDAFEVHAELGRVLRAAGSLQRCRTHLQRAVDLQPDNLGLHYLLGMTATDAGEVDTAILEFRIALRCGDAEAVPGLRCVTTYRLAERLKEQGYLTAAIELYQAFEQVAAGLSDSSEAEPELAGFLQANQGIAAGPLSEAYEALGRFDRAAEELTRHLQSRTPTVDEWSRLIALLSKAGRHGQAVAEARRLVEMNPSATGALVEAHRRAGHAAAAADDLAGMVAARPDEAMLVLAYADVLDQLGRGAQAEEAQAAYLERHPDQSEVRWRLFDTRIGRGALVEAVSAAAEAIRADGDAAATARSKVLALDQTAGEAILAHDDARRLAEEDDAFAFLLGCLARREGANDRAEALLQRVVERLPELMAARIELGALFIDRYRWQACLDLVSGFADGEPTDARIEWLVGEAYVGLDETEQAIVHLGAALRLNRDDTRARRALARLHESANRPLRAIRQYRLLVETNPLDAAAREALVQLYFRNNDRQAATEQLAELRKMAALPNRIARCVAILGHDPRAPDYDRFRKTLTDAMEATQPDCRSLTLVGITYLDQARYDEAVDHLEKAVAVDPDDVDAQLALEFAYRMVLQFSKSAALLAASLERYPNRTEWVIALIDVLVTDQKYDAALDVIRGGLARTDLDDRRRQVYRYSMVMTLEAAGRHDAQIKAARRWHENDPGDADLRNLLIDAYGTADRHADALPVIEAWYEQEPDNYDCQFIYTDYLVRAEQGDRACQLLLEWLERDPDSDDLQRLLARRLSDLKRYDDALELTSNALLEARTPLVYQELALRIYEAADRHAEAVTLLGDLLHDPGQHGDRAWQEAADGLRVEQARQLVLAGRFNEAQVRLNRWLTQSREPEARFGYLRMLSICHQEQGQLAQAMEILEQAHRLRPLDAGINNDLAYNWVDAGIRLDEALACLRYAVAQEPRNYAYLDSLGWVQYKRGDFAAAVEWLTRARRAGQDDDPVITDHLGDALWRAHRRDEAAEAWRATVEHAAAGAAGVDEAQGFIQEERRRVLSIAQAKLTQFGAGQQPAVAPLG